MNNDLKDNGESAPRLVAAAAAVATTNEGSIGVHDYIEDDCAWNEGPVDMSADYIEGLSIPARGLQYKDQVRRDPEPETAVRVPGVGDPRTTVRAQYDPSPQLVEVIPLYDDPLMAQLRSNEENARIQTANIQRQQDLDRQREQRLKKGVLIGLVVMGILVVGGIVIYVTTTRGGPVPSTTTGSPIPLRPTPTTSLAAFDDCIGFTIDTQEISSLGTTSTLPSCLGQLTELTSLDLRDEFLVGTIPTELGRLTKLKEMFLHRSIFTGTLPTEIGKLTELATFLVYENRLKGTIPTEMGMMKSLERLALGNLDSFRVVPNTQNQFTGTIPTEMFQLTSLTSLSLSRNKLTGALPTQFGQLTALISLAVYNNQFVGTVPAEMGQLTSLRALELIRNNFTGLLPTQLGQLTALTGLTLNENQFVGRIPTEMGQLTILEQLGMRANNLTGPLPTQFGQLTALTGLYVSDNNLTGTIPSELENLMELNFLWLYNNYLTGTIPTYVSNIATVILTGNRFMDTWTPTTLPMSVPATSPTLANCKPYIFDDEGFLSRVASTCTGNILEVARGIKELSLTVQQIELAGLSDVLSCPGPFTALFPANGAFERLPPGHLDVLRLPENVALLRASVLYHILPGVSFIRDFQEGTLRPLSGGNTALDTAISPLVFNGVTSVISPNIVACNGVIHVLDGLLEVH